MVRALCFCRRRSSTADFQNRKTCGRSTRTGNLHLTTRSGLFFLSYSLDLFAAGTNGLGSQGSGTIKKAKVQNKT